MLKPKQVTKNIFPKQLNFAEWVGLVAANQAIATAQQTMQQAQQNKLRVMAALGLDPAKDYNLDQGKLQVLGEVESP